MKTNIPKKAPAILGFNHMVHGGDYNPDQWLSYPDVLKEDVRLMKLAGINSVSLAIFAWKALESQEGVYTFEWLDETMDRLHAAGITVILATPSGARPAWMDEKHPEAMRTNSEGIKAWHGRRHNHCYTSPYYRKKVFEMNTMIAKRYQNHPAVTMWHLSNEYGGECHCDYCQEAFRQWLKVKYENDIEKLNSQWWTYFWSHGYNSFDEIHSPSERGENAVHGQNLDWKRFVSYQTTEFIKNEVAAVKAITPNIPTTINLMGTYQGLDPWVMAKEVDLVSWDNYPKWHNNFESEYDTASQIAFVHDLNRSLKQKPFFLMESTPSQVNWQPVNKLKRPNMHLLSSIQAVAHGSDSVQYFQFRKGRGASEKFHGAVVDHVGHENTRVFKEVAKVGEVLSKLDGIVGTNTPATAAVIYDWNNSWAIDDLQGLNDRREYTETCMSFYKTLWQRAVQTDIIEMNEDFSKYKLLVAPMLYMLKPGVADRLKEFTENGGQLVLSYTTGNVNENDLCFLGGLPGDGMMALTGVWAEEIDSLFVDDRNSVIFNENSISATGTYEVKDLCELITALEGCEILATYGSDFYKGNAAITKNNYGKGSCYYFATRCSFEGITQVMDKIIDKLDIAETEIKLPKDVSLTHRVGDGEDYVFIMNFSKDNKVVELPHAMFDMLTSQTVEKVVLNDFGFAILKK